MTGKCPSAFAGPDWKLNPLHGLWPDSGLFVPTTPEEVSARGWDAVDIVLVSGDAYVDHPAFGSAIVARLLEKHGFRVAILTQPDWRTADSFRIFGRPRLFFGITAGVLDSMVNHYTGNRKIRRNDDYGPGGAAGFRPNRAVIVYANRVREAYADVPIVLGGIEASLRRFAHYDYWDDRVRRSILMDTRADLLCYGMADGTIVEVAKRAAAGERPSEMRDLQGIAYVTKDIGHLENPAILHSYEEVAADKWKYARAFKEYFGEQSPWRARPVAQKHAEWYVVQHRPAVPLAEPEMDQVYALPYTRRWHPKYDAAGGVPALETVRWSITSHRGCYGACSFCAIYFHQGGWISNRSEENVVAEAAKLAGSAGFKGSISDVGGPTANMYKTGCDIEIKKTCRFEHCLAPSVCKHLKVDHGPYMKLLEAVRAVKGVKHVRVATGVRYDMATMPGSEGFIELLCKHYVGGQLKVAPEHASETTLRAMNKPSISKYDEFLKRYREENARLGRKQYQVQYFISGHPGCDVHEAIKLAEYIRDQGHFNEQIQDFTPTPMTAATCMYHTGIDPTNMKPVYVPKTARERRWHRALCQFSDAKNWYDVREALVAAGRQDLIGTHPKALIGPRPGQVNRGSQKRREENRTYVPRIMSEKDDCFE
ncbi:MAG: YgiQ family radical SAM protein [Planctomycetes bacterium]|nr:YgiQ family radical SAM protein [Planctomycetota bacterium]